MEVATMMRRVVPLAALLVLMLTHDAYACQDSRKAAASGPHNGRAPLIIGDSTMIFAAPYLGRRGLEADAHGCRQFSEGVSMLAARRRAGTLPRLAILALGANGPVGSGQLAGALKTVGPGHVLGLVTPRKYESTVTAMRALARAHPSSVLLIDWVAFSGPHGGWFGDDKIHVNDAGARAFTDLVARRAAWELPPPRKLAVPRGSRKTKPCGTIHRGGRTLRVHVAHGRDRITCRRARQIARRPPVQGVSGWRAYDWRDAKPGPWQDIYARGDRKVIVGTVVKR
jgi:hypothetical protein